jgi:hypothetical protein
VCACVRGGRGERGRNDSKLESVLPPGDVGLDEPEHLEGRRVDLDKDTVVNLPQPEELQDLPDLGADLVDTPARRKLQY